MQGITLRAAYYTAHDPDCLFVGGDTPVRLYRYQIVEDMNMYNGRYRWTDWTARTLRNVVSFYAKHGKQISVLNTQQREVKPTKRRRRGQVHDE